MNWESSYASRLSLGLLLILSFGFFSNLSGFFLMTSMAGTAIITPSTAPIKHSDTAFDSLAFVGSVVDVCSG
jgi:hypothetical protein